MEEWKDIEGWPYHQVSNHGRVRVLPGGIVKGRRTVREIEFRILTDNGLGYKRVKRGRRALLVHILVLNAFAGPCPPGFECRHLNNDSADNRWPENLVWGTHEANMAERTSKYNRGDYNSQAKLMLSDVIEINRSDEGTKALAERYSVSRTTIQRVRNGSRWQVD
jgi:hypothetical protein